MTDKTIPRAEYPRPQLKRDEWLNLNGEWTFEFDFGISGLDRNLFESNGFDSKITVPFCPESALSGVKHHDFIPCIWYHREIRIPESWKGRRTMINFGAVDYQCEVYIDGKLVGRHFGGSSSFSFDLSRFVSFEKAHNLVLRVLDDPRSGKQTGGKQSVKYRSAGCHYTRVTGIWQTVWLEPVSETALRDCQIIPDLDGSRFIINPRFFSLKQGFSFNAELCDGKTIIASQTSPTANLAPIILEIDEPKYWSPDSPFLYDLKLRILDSNGSVVDEIESYAGLRKIHCEGDRVFLNNQELYQRLVLDQGFYSDGIWTAPSDEALRRDIELSKKAGFNGARLHQKVFEERFHYWADKLGYLTWGESASWGCDVNDEIAARNFLNEWSEVIVRDRNHPSIITWTPLNETCDVRDATQHHRLHVDAYDCCKNLDATRPVNDSSGYVHVKTDLWTTHNYTQNPEKLFEQLKLTENGEVWRNHPDLEVDYEGQPYLVDEFGGIKWIPAERQEFANNSWGYGDDPKNLEEFYTRLEAQVKTLLSIPHIRGYCYTQLTDVEQEENGIYNYDRSEKFDMERIHRIFSQTLNK